MGKPLDVAVPPASMGVVWDWTPLQPGWPAFAAAAAWRQWTAAFDTAGMHNRLVSLIVHPWIAELNDEYAVLEAVLQYACSRGVRFATFDSV